MPLRRAARRAVAGAAVAAVAAGSYVAGVAAGAGSGGPPPPSVLEEAAARIEGSALRPVGRSTLDAAAIQGMLHAASDPWGQWQATAPPRSPAPLVRVTSVPAAAGPVTVIAVRSFERGTGRQVRTAVERPPAGRSGIVLDLRGNAGGLLDEAVETASAFLDGGVVVHCTRRDGSVQRFDAIGAGDTRTPLAVLVDGGSASAAEVVAGALADGGRGVLVGSRTYGKGTVQEPGTLSDGSSLQLTVASYTTPSGRSVEGVGLQPDIQVAPASPPEVALRRAVDVLAGLRADGSR